MARLTVVSFRRRLCEDGQQQHVHPSSWIVFPALILLLPETGGLLRIGIKLIMACSTTNIDVYVFGVCTVIMSPSLAYISKSAMIS
jgi:hypothetical protein